MNAVYDIITEEQTIFRNRNKILKIADRHGRDTVKEYLDSPLADDKEDASDLRAAISRANRTPKPYNRPDNQYGSVNRGSGSPKCNTRRFFFVALANSAEWDLILILLFYHLDYRQRDIFLRRRSCSGQILEIFGFSNSSLFR